MDIFLLVMRLILAGVFATSGIAKLADRDGSEKAMVDFGVPSSLARYSSLLLSLAELVIAIGLLFITTSWFGALGCATLLLVFIVMMMYQYARGNAPDCHCFGQLQKEPVGILSIVRNIVLLVPAGILSVQGRNAQGLVLISTAAEAVLIVLAGAVAILLILILNRLSSVPETQKEILERLDTLEVSGVEAQPVERENIGHPREGLPIGSLVPEFELPDVDGNTVSLASLKALGKPVLFLFVSPVCGPCRALVSEFESWEQEFADKIKFVFVSDRSTSENKRKYQADGRLILVQKEREIAELFRAQWTPEAVLMNTNGRIASSTEAGDVGLRRMIEWLRSGDPTDTHTYFTADDYRTLTRIRVGEEIPEVSGKDIAGVEFDSTQLKGKEALLTFWSSNCPFCVDMMEQIREWETVKNGSSPELVLFVHAREDEAAALDLKSRVVMDTGQDLGDKLGQFGTPSAILVDANGKFISETAVGAEDIWALVGKRF